MKNDLHDILRNSYKGLINGSFMEKIVIFDTTLRDGDQASGFHLIPEEKLKIARQLAKLGVDVIEAGFAASSIGDFDVISRIAKEVGTKDGPVICSLARTVESDVEAAGKALESAVKKRIHVFIATSDIHIKGKLKKDKIWVIEQAVNSVKKAKEFTDDIEFSCEDFGRTDEDYTIEVVGAAIKAGATTINLPDTVGWLTPREAYRKVKYVIGKIKEKKLDAVFSVHNHNDFGMATANTIQGVLAGARQVEVTINGIGERAGNTALEEVVAILKTREIADCNVKSELIGEASKLLSELTGIYPQPNKAVVGKNAFAHEAGIHQDGVIKERTTYEIMNPDDFGVESVLTFGPRSGRNALREKFKQLGINLNEESFEKTAKNFKALADEKKEVDDADLILAVKNETEIPEHYKLVSYKPVEVNGKFKVEIKLNIDGNIVESCEKGNGQIDSAINGIHNLILDGSKLEDFRVCSGGPGSDAFGNTKVVVSKNKWVVKGNASDSDVVRSAINAFLDAANRIKYLEVFLGEWDTQN
ncbi:2-isopropylmalate synthase [Candidatus Woesearchaeota archaeon CG10_big_fil_rev_8_21_14_0_10_34_12]|nr:MAG: 2-isopropylmalate synthase [Candidatus Woesearchaeota archaeon CG10_big_fil_rev_8_21_14_0_10_34_12]